MIISRSMFHTSPIPHGVLFCKLRWVFEVTIGNPEEIKRELHDCRCNERLKTKDEVSTRLVYTGLLGGLEHLMKETRLRDERSENVKGECVI